jgi:hypothetical protein
MTTYSLSRRNWPSFSRTTVGRRFQTAEGPFNPYTAPCDDPDELDFPNDAEQDHENETHTIEI